jgi:hypothetical protein
MSYLLEKYYTFPTWSRRIPLVWCTTYVDVSRALRKLHRQLTPVETYFIYGCVKNLLNNRGR